MNLKQLQKDRVMIQDMIRQYNTNPEGFSDERINELMQLSKMYGIDFEPRTSIGRLAGSFVGNLADTALFGMVPDKWYPQARTTGESIAGGAGSLLGLVPAFGIGGLAYKGAAKGVKAGYQATKGSKAVIKAQKEFSKAREKLIDLIGDTQGAYARVAQARPTVGAVPPVNIGMFGRAGIPQQPPVPFTRF